MHADVSFAGSYAPLRCSPDSPAVLSLVLQQAMAVADLAQRNLLEYEEGCTLRSCAIDDRQVPGRRGVVQGNVDAATAESMLAPFHSHMQNLAKENGMNIDHCESESVDATRDFLRCSMPIVQVMGHLLQRSRPTQAETIRSFFPWKIN